MKAPLKGQVQREGGSPWWSLDSRIAPSAVAVGNAEGGSSPFTWRGPVGHYFPARDQSCIEVWKKWAWGALLSLNCLGKREGKRALLFRAPTVCQPLSHKCFSAKSSWTLWQLWGYYLLEGASERHGLRLLIQPTGWLLGPNGSAVHSPWLWANYLISLSLGSFTCKMGTVMVSIIVCAP